MLVSPISGEQRLKAWSYLELLQVGRRKVLAAQERSINGQPNQRAIWQFSPQLENTAPFKLAIPRCTYKRKPSSEQKNIQCSNVGSKRWKILCLSVRTGSINYRVNTMHLMKRISSSFGSGKISKVCY